MIFAFFGYNESFAGEAGCPEKVTWLETSLSNSRVRSTTADRHRDSCCFRRSLTKTRRSRICPTRSRGQIKPTMEAVHGAMAEVAKAQSVPSIDLHAAELKPSRGRQPLTINGVHHRGPGDQTARRRDDGRSSPAGAARDPAPCSRSLRQATVNDKTCIGSTVIAPPTVIRSSATGRFLTFTDGQTNYDVAQRELEVLDVRPPIGIGEFGPSPRER